MPLPCQSQPVTEEEARDLCRRVLRAFPGNQDCCGEGGGGAEKALPCSPR